MQKFKWEFGPKNPELSDSNIHVWRIQLPIQDGLSNILLQHLSDDEKSRMDKYHFAVDKSRFLAARAALRQLISYYLDTSPEKIPFNYTEFGKPFIDIIDAPLKFNLSHANNCILIAITKNADIGIDVEEMKPEIDLLGVARLILNDNEYNKLQALREEERVFAFYRAWTRKEAFIKAIGKGFSFPLKQVEVTLLPEETNQIVAIEGSHNKGNKDTQWRLIEIIPGPNYLSSLAVAENIQNINLWDFNFT